MLYDKSVKGEVCMGLADGIEAQMLKTKKQNFGGGNTKWEEKSVSELEYYTHYIVWITQVCNEVA